MINIVVKENAIAITGHADYDEEGKDIVCASVSSMVITTINAIIRLDKDAIIFKEKDGVFIDIIKHTNIIDTLLDNLLQLLKELENQYPKYIKMRRC